MSRPIPPPEPPPPPSPTPSAWRLLLGALMGALCFLLMEDLGFWNLVPTPGLSAAWPIVAIVVFVLIASSRFRNWAPIISLVFLLLWGLIASTNIAGALAEPLRSSDRPVKSDAVVVLSSEVRPDNELPSEALSRLMTGIELVRQGYAPRMVLTEVPPPSGSYAGAAKELLAALRLDVPIEPVAERVRNTHDEAVLVAELARERGWTKVLVVTSPLHLKRAKASFEKAGLSVMGVPAPNPHYSVVQPDSRIERLRLFSDALHEWVGIFVYGRRGWL